MPVLQNHNSAPDITKKERTKNCSGSLKMTLLNLHYSCELSNNNNNSDNSNLQCLGCFKKQK